MVSGEPDFQSRMNALVDIWKIKGLVVKDPYIPLSIPISVENPALAYDDVNDRFYVDISALSVGTLPISLEDSWTRILGQFDLARISGAAIAHSNPLLVRLSNGTGYIDPRLILGSQTQQLKQRGSTYELLVQLALSGVEIDPRSIRPLTASDIVSAVKSGTWNIDNLLNPHPVSLASLPNPSNLDIAISLLARETTLGTVHSHVDSIDGKITACNTGAVVVASGAVTETNSGSVKTAVEAIDNCISGNEAQVDVLSLPTITQSTKHDSKVYAPAIFDASSSGTLKAAVADKVTKLHALVVQAQGTVTVNINNGSGGASLMEFSLQAREGVVLPLASSPAYWAVTSENTILYVTLSAAVQVTITAIVSSDDAS